MPEPILENARALSEQEAVVVDDRLVSALSWLFETVGDDVLRYLGPDVRVDNILINRVPPGDPHKSISGSWHDDGAGHRLKLFLCIEGSGDVPTAVVVGSNQRKYFPQLRHFYRFRGTPDFEDDKNQILIGHRTGDVTLFDTNARHRGVYERSHAARTVLIIELADRRKSNHFNGAIAIGPGNAGIAKFSILRNIAHLHAKEFFLDPDLFRPQGKDHYVYG